MAPSLNAQIRRQFRRREYGGSTHRILRQNLAPLVASGAATCAICGHPIPAGAAWDLAHAENRLFYLGPAHQICNRRTAKKTVDRTSRQW